MRFGLALFFSFLVWPASGAAPPLWGALTPGPERVGFTRLERETLEVAVWYPAGSGGAPLTFGDYAGAGKEELSKFLVGTGISTETVERFLGSRVLATADPKLPKKRFPLVLVAQGNGESVPDQAILAEYLASHGYVVATTPSPAVRRAMKDASEIGEFAELQASDLMSALRVVREAMPIDTDRVAIVGHSFGARSALLLAMQEPHVKAIVSLDGGIGTATGIDSLRGAPSFDARKELPAILHLFERVDAFMKPDFAFLESLHAKRLVRTELAGMHHVHFTSYGFAAASFPEIAKVTHAGPEIATGVKSMAGGTLDFLNRELKR